MTLARGSRESGQALTGAALSGGLGLFRRFPALIDPLLPKTLPSFFIQDDQDPRGSEILDLGHAQAVIPGGRLDRGLASQDARP